MGRTAAHNWSKLFLEYNQGRSSAAKAVLNRLNKVMTGAEKIDNII
ncbi:hypothetical protein Psch_02918 [Pelotomaculum schinkii]|uniref:Uncharacterized protein n=1 Tax=Pelotomaculum schinkii TaxID=78350 RepID=A0A4Y7RAQ2_9FIRM|nr:hypothetical protein Psch_02918 [Pelotomaculum schinkii]